MLFFNFTSFTEEHKGNSVEKMMYSPFFFDGVLRSNGKHPVEIVNKQTGEKADFLHFLSLFFSLVCISLHK